MAQDNEPAKLLLPYLQRADELQKHDPLVAYYCRLYAMERGLRIPQSDRTKTTNALLVSLMKQLEKDKKSLKLGPDDNLHLEGFALDVFAKADKQDRAGRADLSTAKTFYASSIFFEVINQFGELPPDLEQKQKYAAWKAADIRKALKEGRKPLPGPPVGDDDLRILSSTSSGEYDLEPSRSDVSTQPDLSTGDPAARSVPDSNSSPQVYGQGSFHHSTSIPPPSSNSAPAPAAETSQDSDSSLHVCDQGCSHHSTSIPRPASNPMSTPSPSSGISKSLNYPTDNYPSDGLHHQPSTNYYQQSYLQPYQPEPQQHLPEQYPQQYPSHNAPPPYSYPNFQSYPSFADSSLPVAPSHYPSYYNQDSGGSYINYSPPNAAKYPSTPQHNPSNSDGSAPNISPPTVQKFEYDSSYQPPPEKIAEAHKAARFAVGALAFDDVSVAVDYLKKSLELLTNPSAAH